MSSLIRRKITLFGYIDKKEAPSCRPTPNNDGSAYHKTTRIEANTVEIEERGVKLRLTVVDTPGYGDSTNCTEWY